MPKDNDNKKEEIAKLYYEDNLTQKEIAEKLSITQGYVSQVIKEDETRAATILRVCLNLIRIYAILSAPLMPQTAEKILAKFNLTPQDMSSLKDFNIAEQIDSLPAGTPFAAGDALFELILKYYRMIADGCTLDDLRRTADAVKAASLDKVI